MSDAQNPNSGRADLGFGAALEDLDIFAPTKPAKPKPKAPKEDTAKAAQAAGFKSREAAPAEPQAKPPRRRRTGRNAQFNIKARPETIEAYCEIADANNWGLGETLEHAVALLRAHQGSGNKGGNSAI